MSNRDAEQLRRMTDGIVDGQARHRRQARWAMLAGAVLVVVVAIPTALVVNHPAVPGRPADGAARMPVPAAAGGLADDASVYAVVLIDWQRSGRLIVHDRVCTSAGACSAGRSTLRLRRELSARVGPRLHFTATAERAVALQKITVRGSRATVTLKDSCGPGCFSGERVHLTRTETSWRITGDREQWIT